MPHGSKASYTGKQKREAKHIEDSYEKRGVSKKTAEKRAWATVNKQDGGGKKSGSGTKKAATKKTTTKKTAVKKTSAKTASSKVKASKKKTSARGKK